MPLAGTSEPDPFAVALEVGRVLEELGVRYSLGGSLASSIHGFARATLDADLVADLHAGQGRDLARRLGRSYYADAGAIESAIAERRSFNVIHLASMFKVDVFLLKDDSFSQTSFARSRPEVLRSGGGPILVATPEDTILHKLLWFEKGGRVSERQWTDSVGVLRVQGSRIDRAYLAEWAGRLGVSDLLARAFEEGEWEG